MPKSPDELRKRTDEIFERLNSDLDVQKFDKEPEPIPRFHSGSWKLDRILGGGWPWGRLIELFGTQSSGKTTVALHACKEAQKEGHVCGFVDVEHALDPVYAFNGIGVDREALLFQQPRSGEQALETVEKMVQEGVDLVVLDSMASLTPQAELDGEIGDDHVGLTARLMSQTLRRLASVVKEEGATVIFINQIRMKIGTLFGDPETTPGGKSLKFYSSIRLRLSPSSHRKDDGETIGNEVNARCAKNKTAAPFKSDKLMIRYGEGLDRAYELRERAENLGAIEKAGSWYKIAGDTICQGSEALEEMIRENVPADSGAGPPEGFGLRERLKRRVVAISKDKIEAGDVLPMDTD